MRSIEPRRFGCNANIAASSLERPCWELRPAERPKAPATIITGRMLSSSRGRTSSPVLTAIPSCEYPPPRSAPRRIAFARPPRDNFLPSLPSPQIPTGTEAFAYPTLTVRPARCLDILSSCDQIHAPGGRCVIYRFTPVGASLAFSGRGSVIPGSAAPRRRAASTCSPQTIAVSGWCCLFLLLAHSVSAILCSSKLYQWGFLVPAGAEVVCR